MRETAMLARNHRSPQPDNYFRKLMEPAALTGLAVAFVAWGGLYLDHYGKQENAELRVTRLEITTNEQSKALSIISNQGAAELARLDAMGELLRTMQSNEAQRFESLQQQIEHR